METQPVDKLFTSLFPLFSSTPHAFLVGHFFLSIDMGYRGNPFPQKTSGPFLKFSKNNQSTSQKSTSYLLFKNVIIKSYTIFVYIKCFDENELMYRETPSAPKCLIYPLPTFDFTPSLLLTPPHPTGKELILKLPSSLVTAHAQEY